MLDIDPPALLPSPSLPPLPPLSSDKHGKFVAQYVKFIQVEPFLQTERDIQGVPPNADDLIF